MAFLVKQPAGPRSLLLSPHMVGRSRLSDLRMSEPTVSNEHAVIRWGGRAWELHDLGSRNGTYLDGRRLPAGERVALARGAMIAFGQPDNAWQLVDDAPPSVVALPSAGDQQLGARSGLLALPSEDNPEMVVYRNAAGDWIAEQNGDASRIKDGATVHVAGADYTLRVPDLTSQTWDSLAPILTLGTMTARFEVSRDEEYIALSMRDGRQVLDLGARAHHVVLLCLARSRLEDRGRPAAEPLPESAEGWVYQDELASKLAIDETHLNVAVFRCRKQLAEAGIVDAASIIERRRPTREVRLGMARIEIVTV
ncbi:MAG TPA: FHA domain-containing protein [Kofleriaceae bacterium]